MAVEKKLPPRQFNSVIRLIKRSPIDRAKQLRQATFFTLKRLKVKRDLTKAIKGIPEGSDQGDVGSIVTWLKRIEPKNRPAIRQVVAIDATAVARVDGV